MATETAIRLAYFLAGILAGLFVGVL